MKPFPSLTSRADQLRDLLAATRCSDANGGDLPLEEALDQAVERLERLRAEGRGLFLIGNGGSAAVAAHSAIDFLNKGRMRALTLDSPPTLTCLANDFGYDQAYARALERISASGDLLIAISSSGGSPNIVNGVAAAAAQGAEAVTLSGFKPDNPLRRTGLINFWLDSSDYGQVEIGHQFILHHLSDRVAIDAL